MELILRPWSPADTEALTYIGQHVERTYLSGVPDPFREKDAEWYIRFAQSHEGKTGIFRAVCVDGRPVGVISINRLNEILKKDCQLGAYMIPEYTSKGLMTRSLRLMVRMAFASLDITRISAAIIKGNTASCRMVEKNGFELEGTIRNSVWKNDRINDLLIYGKLR